MPGDDLNKVTDEGLFTVRTKQYHGIGFLRMACKTHHYRVEYGSSWAVLVPATWSKVDNDEE